MVISMAMTFLSRIPKVRFWEAGATEQQHVEQRKMVRKVFQPTEEIKLSSCWNFDFSLLYFTLYKDLSDGNNQ